ncbi:MAG: hypothetical protein KatS3mg104_3242 [Phycisphaerae bacterium]|nr:MAG: hypothetical protein KatS3mg104_3242 [Phycisphaerae bacterium]
MFVELDAHGVEDFITLRDVPGGLEFAEDTAVFIPAALLEDENILHLELIIFFEAEHLRNTGDLA